MRLKDDSLDLWIFLICLRYFAFRNSIKRILIENPYQQTYDQTEHSDLKRAIVKYKPRRRFIKSLNET